MKNERFTLEAELADLRSEFGVDRIEFPYYENAEFEPTGIIPAIRPAGGFRTLGAQRWGLMPYWGKSSIRADRRTLGEKPYLWSMLAKKRCVVPCSRFLFEKTEGKQKRICYRMHPDKPVFGIAGIFDLWIDSEKNEFPMCTLLVSRSPENGVDDGVPLVLEGEAMAAWLDPGLTSPQSLRELLHAIPEPEWKTGAVENGSFR